MTLLGKVLGQGKLQSLDSDYLNNNQAGEAGKQAIRHAMAALRLKEDDSFLV